MSSKWSGTVVLALLSVGCVQEDRKPLPATPVSTPTLKETPNTPPVSKKTPASESNQQAKKRPVPAKKSRKTSGSPAAAKTPSIKKKPQAPAGQAKKPDKTCAVCRGDFSRVFRMVSPSVVGVAAGTRVDGRFKISRRGTGFAWDDAGHIVTNAHAVAEATEVRVRTQDGKVVRSRIVGLDANTDLAVLVVDGLELEPIARGDYSAVSPGQWVAAIGNPYGMDHSITVGVVSAIGRKNLPPGAPKYADFIQSDVSIFPGNSGGPLVNDEGQVIGLNTAKLGQGLSFSTRIDMVETVTDRLVREGRFDRGFAGLFVRHVSAKTAESCGLPRPTGARVRGVVSEAPAELAGLQSGDVILEFDGRKIGGPAALPWMIAATRPGRTVDVKIARKTDRLTLQLTVSDPP